MQFFIDTANITEIKELNQTGLLDGVTTNPSLIAKEGKDLKETIAQICQIVNGPVSAEVTANDYENMIIQGDKLAQIAPNVCIKLPMTLDGIKACKYFSDKKIATNVTLCFSASQAILAAKAGATFVSPFLGRLDDISFDGLNLIEEIVTIYRNYPQFNTKILAASIRNPIHITAAAKIGADVATIPAKIIKQLIKHPLTDQGLEIFNKATSQSNQKI